jgi:tetratricopeptide (TPR) repeat protein
LAAAAQQAYRQADTLYQKEPRSLQAGWGLGRACFDLAELAGTSAERAALAQQGMAACRRALTQATNCAPAHYYLGLNLGQLARTKGLGALKLVGQMERELSAACDLDEHFDYAGADRSLGLLYRDAPALGSIGSRTKARQHLQRAVELAPNYPENRLNLAETQLKWGDHKDAASELKSLEEEWSAAHAAFAGPAWASNWADWEPRLQKLKKKLEQPPKTLESPHH